MFSVESPRTIFNIKKKITLNYSKSAVMGFFSKGLKNKFETAVVNEPSVFELLKFYCIYFEIPVFGRTRISSIRVSPMKMLAGTAGPKSDWS